MLPKSKALSAQKKITVVASILIRIFSLVFLYRLKQSFKFLTTDKSYVQEPQNAKT